MNVETALLEVTQEIEAIDAYADDLTIARCLAALEAVANWHKAQRAALKEKMLAWVEAHGPLILGHKRYYIGTETETKCRDVVATLKAFLERTDIDTLANCLASGCWKPGESRKSLPPEVFAELFSVEEKTVLKDGKPTKRQLLEADERYSH